LYISKYLFLKNLCTHFFLQTTTAKAPYIEEERSRMEIGKAEDVSFVIYGLDLCTYLLPFSILSTLYGIPHPFTKARKGGSCIQGFFTSPSGIVPAFCDTPSNLDFMATICLVG
jgi:hypothetical protein